MPHAPELTVQPAGPFLDRPDSFEPRWAVIFTRRGFTGDVVEERPLAFFSTERAAHTWAARHAPTLRAVNCPFSVDPTTPLLHNFG